MKPNKRKKAATSTINDDWSQQAAFWLSLSLLVAVPLAFNTAVYRIYALPKFAILLVGASLLVPVVLLAASKGRAGDEWPRLFKSKHMLMICAYLAWVTVATLFSEDPIASLFGSSYNQMGLITHLSFFVCLVSLIFSIGESEERLNLVLWAIALTGLGAALYAVAQFFGIDPLAPASLYTFESAGEAIIRPSSTLGHANYLGNFLLYTTPLSAALALAGRGRARMIALIGVALSICAIIFSGTRGAWLGIGAGAVAFTVLELQKRLGQALAENRRRVIRSAALALIILLVAVSAISLSPASRNIVVRARSLVTEGFTGAGRTILWRDSLRMAPDYALTGCGPELFRKSFLAYKSKELARYAPQVNNESSHNSYLDAAINYGLPGAIAYIAMIVSAFSLLLGARRREENRRWKIIIAGIVSSLVAVIAHNNFIYDQIPTGFYFFVFIALAQVVSNVVGKDVPTQRANDKRQSAKDHASASIIKGWPGRAMMAIACVIPVMSIWYSVALLESDAQVKWIIASARAGDFESMERYREIAVSSPEPTANYDPLFIRILSAHSSRFAASASGQNSVWSRALSLVARDAERSLAHTLTPESDYGLMAYLSLAANDTARLRAYATEAVKWDPNFFEARWLMAEAFLREGDRERAVEEAELALDIYPASGQARSALKRAQGQTGKRKRLVEEMIEDSRTLIDAGKTKKAEQTLRQAIRKSKGACPACHRALALLYEATDKKAEAIAEWRIFIREDPEGAAAEQIESRVKNLAEGKGN